MGTEIERKYLIRDWDAAKAAILAYHKEGYAGFHIRQGYLNTEPTRTVRVRVIGQPARLAFLTIKGLSKGISRPEFEYSIPPDEGEQLLELCDSRLEKIRYTLLYQSKVWEIDEFLGHNAGLRLAEIELKSENEAYTEPDWLGEDVSQEPCYYNSNLCAPDRRCFNCRTELNEEELLVCSPCLHSARKQGDDLDAYVDAQSKKDPNFAAALAKAIAKRFRI